MRGHSGVAPKSSPDECQPSPNHLRVTSRVCERGSHCWGSIPVGRWAKPLMVHYVIDRSPQSCESSFAPCGRGSAENAGGLPQAHCGATFKPKRPLRPACRHLRLQARLSRARVHPRGICAVFLALSPFPPCFYRKFTPRSLCKRKGSREPRERNAPRRLAASEHSKRLRLCERREAGAVSEPRSPRRGAGGRAGAAGAPRPFLPLCRQSNLMTPLVSK